MKESKLKDYFGPIVLGFLFTVYTILVYTFDKAPIGPEGSMVGFSKLNSAMLNALNVSMASKFYDMSEKLGLFALFFILVFAFIGLIRLIKGRSLRAVNPRLYCLGGFYAIMGGFYFLFELLIINYRPVIMDEGLEASYPSSHTMLALCVFVSAIPQLFDMFKARSIRAIIVFAMTVFSVLTVVFRLLSGVHWFTDILGGVLLSAFLLSGYATALKLISKKQGAN